MKQHATTLFAALAVAFPLAAQKTDELAKLEAERAKVAAEVEAAQKIADTKAELARLRKALKDLKNGKTPAAKPVTDPPRGAPVLPKWVPQKLPVGAIAVVQDPNGGWWYVEHRHNDRGNYSLHGYGRGKVAKARAEEFAEAVRRNQGHRVLGN